jgi:uncharacterized protein YndB with AHSA1/START domain
MSLGFRVSGRIGKPVADVFDAVVNPKKLSGYFTTIGGASAPLEAGAGVVWWGKVPVEVDEVVKDSRIVLRWDATDADGKPAYKTRIEMNFELLDDGGTFHHRRERLAGRCCRPEEILSQLRGLVADAGLHEGLCRIRHQFARRLLPQ